MSKKINNNIGFVCSIIIIGLIFIFSSSNAEEETQETPIPIHMNFKEGAKFSPETSGDVERIAIEEKYSSHEQNPGGGTPVDTRNKGDWTKMGEWESDSVLFDIALSDAMFNLWWVEDPDDTDYDAALDLRWTLYLDGNEIFQFTDEEGYTCEETRDEPCEYTKIPDNSFPNTALTKGQVVSLKVEMKSFQAIYIYYDNLTRDSGMKIVTDAVKFGKTGISGQTVSFEFIEAWSTKTDESITGNFITLLVNMEELDNNQQEKGYPKIESGPIYLVNETEISSVKITWFIEDEYAKLDQSVISFSLGRKISSTTEPIIINVADRLMPNSGVSENEGSILDLSGFNLIITILSISLISYLRREV